MKRGTKISRWLNQVKADRRLCASDIAVAIQLTQRTNEDEFGRSGDLLTWQGVATQAKETGLDARTVQRATRRLQGYGHIAVEPGGGRHRSNRITLIVKTAPSLQAETPASLPPFSRQNPDTRAGVSKRKTPASVARNPGSGDAKPRQRCHPNLLKNNSITLATTAETENRGPRGLDGLGPLVAALRSRHGDAEVNAWFARPGREVEFVSLIDGTITLSVPSRLFEQEIRKRFETTIAKYSRAAMVKFIVRPPTARGAMTLATERRD